MNTGQRIPFFSPLNIASLIFIIIICHVTVQFNRNGGKGKISHEKMEQGCSDSFLEAAREPLPCRIGNSYLKFADVVFEDNCVIFKVSVPENAVEKFENNIKTLDPVEYALYYCAALQDQYTEWTKITNRNTNRSRVLDAIIAGRYPIKFRFYHSIPETGQADESLFIAELTATADQYIPKWKNGGLKSEYYTSDDY